MSLTRKNYIRIAAMIAVIAAMFIISGLMANAQAAEYTSILPQIHNNGDVFTANDVELKYSQQDVYNESTGDYGNKIILAFKKDGKTTKVTRTQSFGTDYVYYQVGGVLTNGNYAYYAFGKQDATSAKTMFYKLNLSTGKSTLMRTVSGNNATIVGVYGTKIYYVDGKSHSSKNDHGNLKRYNTETKKTATVLEEVSYVGNDHHVIGRNGRYIYLTTSYGSKLNIVDTHTGKIVKSLTFNPSYSILSYEGFTSTKILIMDDDSVYKMNYDGSGKTKLCESGNYTPVGSYLYKSEYNNGYTYYKIKISDGTKTKVSAETYIAKTGHDW